jgi:hypothetical protein|tara:strand:+ start:625 stop:1710 length:1086 start_codon:yes stop_codon:yes gene_type:complete
MHKSIQRIRYPPFEHKHINPNEINLIEIILESENPPPPPFKIGNDNNWIVEWRKITEEDRLNSIFSIVSSKTPSFLLRTRNGWYIDPDPLHKQARKMITPAVLILMISFLLRALAPSLEKIKYLDGFVEIFWSSFKLGPLNYPAFLLIAFPIFISPIYLRIIANLRDFSRQKKYYSNPLKPPEFDIQIDQNIVTLKNFKIEEGVIINRAKLQVGIPVPERRSVLEALNKTENDQTAPGMSTKLPARRITTSEEHGTGVGETTPMILSNRRVLMLEPMRVMASGQWENYNSKIIELPSIKETWPGSIYSSLIAIHWEIILECVRNNGVKMKWVSPIKIEHTHHKIHIENLPVRSGRIELADD